MNAKKTNIFFLTTILLHFIIVAILVVFKLYPSLGIEENFIISDAMILIPTFIILATSKENWIEALGIHKIKWSTAGMIVLLAFATIPVSSLLNAISMLFVDNAVAGVSEEVLAMPFWEAFFFMAVGAPVSEELAFRGLSYHGYRRSSTCLKAVVMSALLFALGHMNFNQATYAFAIGIMLALLVEATGSILSSIIYHATFNGFSVCMMYLTERMGVSDLDSTIQEVPNMFDSMLMSIGILIPFAVIGATLAICMLAWIAGNEVRKDALKQVWTLKGEKKDKLVSWPLIVGTALAVGYMVADAVLSRLLS